MRSPIQETIEAKIAEFGFTFIGVFPDEERNAPAFCYTIGMKNHGMPELLLIGNMPPWIAQQILGDIAQGWLDAKQPWTGVRENYLPIKGGAMAPIKLVLVKREAAQEYTCQATGFNNTHEYDIVQVLWPDDAGRLPDNPEWNQTMRQPVLPPFDDPATAHIH